MGTTKWTETPSQFNLWLVLLYIVLSIAAISKVTFGENCKEPVTNLCASPMDTCPSGDKKYWKKMPGTIPQCTCEPPWTAEDEQERQKCLCEERVDVCLRGSERVFFSCQLALNTCPKERVEKICGGKVVKKFKKACKEQKKIEKYMEGK